MERLEHKVSKMPSGIRSRAKIASLPVTPLPDVTQFTTRLVYPDVAQLQTFLSSPENSFEKILSSDLLSDSGEATSFMQEMSSSVDHSQTNLHHQSRALLYIRIVLLFLSNLVIPLMLYALLEDWGFHITRILYYAVGIFLLVNVCGTVVRMVFGLRVTMLPEKLALAFPAASAIITACLPEDAETIIETVKVVLSTKYPGPFQVILAYHAPYKMQIERELQKIARYDRRLVLLRVELSNSKAEKISYAARKVTGEFVGIFDADHYPDPNAFQRAWHWLSQEYHVVQGRCVVRNGDCSWITRLVAVESELLYRLEYLACTRIRNFGIFRGANGYWRTDTLRKITMDSNLFAEGIDSSLMALEQGYRIMHDPLLICKELAPETLQDLWNQRVRQSRGRFQVVLEHIWTCLFSPQLSLRQKLGCFNFLIGREVSSRFAAQIIPLSVLQIMYGGWPSLASLFIGSAVIIVSISLLQVLLTYNVALPEIRRHSGWFIFYAVFSLLFFAISGLEWPIF